MLNGIVQGIKNVIGMGGSDNQSTQNLPVDQQQSSSSFQNVVFKEEAVAFVNKEFERRRKERIAFELQWQLNINFLTGNQYCDINVETGSIVDIPKLYWYQEREAYNQIAPIIETRLSKLGRVDPSLKTRPATNERQDVSTSKICTAFLKGNYRRMEMLSKIKSASSWCEQLGTVFYKNIWDSMAGRTMAVMEGQNINEGNLKVAVCPAFEIYPNSIFDPDVDQTRSLIHAKAYNVQEIEAFWPLNTEGKPIDIKGRQVEVFNISQTNVGTGGLGYMSNVQQIMPQKMSDCEIVKEFYEMPSKKYPNGRLIIVAGNELLHYGDLPYKIGDEGERGIPFVRQVCIERPGYFFGISIAERLIPIQRSYNAVMNRINEYLNRCVIGVLTWEEGSIDIDVVREDGIAPGSDIPYARGSQPPRFMENGGLPSEFNQQLRNLEQLFVQISGVSTFSRESAPPVGANSGVAMEIIKEQDDTRLSLTAEHIRVSIVKAGQQWLRIGKQFATGPRLLKYVGKNNNILVLEWQASDITTDDVVLESENELSQTPAQRKQQVIDMLDRKLFNDPTTGGISRYDRVKIFEMMEMGNWESGDDLDEQHVERAQRENLFLEKGQAPAIFKYDDDGIHIQEHLRYVLSSDFEELNKSNPIMAQTMVAHIEQHEKSLSIKTQMSIQSQTMMQQSVAGGQKI